ncbi:SurA N-terminal domain-containing protein [Eubacteriaceae bacterium ES2]|nr:SurA N-terminal domain-containing protein [Eubacteriaceae bacterium ES2]
MITVKKRFLAGFIVAIMLTGMLFSGCSLVSVDPEKDRAQVIAEIGDETILKESFNNYMAYYYMYYKASGMTFPTGDDLNTMKSDLLDDLVRVNVLTIQAKADGVEPADSSTVDVDTMISSLKTSLGDDEYAKVMSTYNTDEESFSAFLTDLMDKYGYADAMQAKFEEDLKADPSQELSTVVGTIDGEDVTKDQYNYQLANQELTYYYTNQSAMPTDDDTMATTNETIFNDLAERKVLAAYAEENGIQADEQDVTDYVSAQDAFKGYLFSDDATFQEYLDSKYLTIEQWDAFVQEDATASAIALAIQDQMKQDVEISDDDIESYYEENKDTYDSDTVSAMHILADTEDQAQSIYEEAKNITTKDEFQALIDKYQDQDGVQEATDLGAFDYDTMVEPFSEAAFAADVNTVTGPVQTDYGYHVIFVYDKHTAEIPSLDDKRDEIKETLTDNAVTDEFDALKESLMKNVKIEINDIQDPFDAYVEDLKTQMNVTVYDNRI